MLLVILTLMVGLFIGAIGKMVMPGPRPGGVAIMLLLGVGGAALATFVGHTWRLYPPGAVGLRLITAGIGSVILLVVFRLFSPRKMASPR